LWFFQVPGVPPNTDFPAQIASSSGPQRSKEDAKGKGKATQKGKGRQEPDPAEPLPEGDDSSWGETKYRLLWEMLEEYHLRPAGRSINPETAFANIKQFIKEDLHRSVSNFFYRDCNHHLMNFLMWQQPLAAKAAEAKTSGKKSLVYERYLTEILMELRGSTGGEKQNETLMFTRGKRSLTTSHTHS
jgi:hypothetical protein